MTRGTAPELWPETGTGHRPLRRAQKHRPYVPKLHLHPGSDPTHRNTAIRAATPAGYEPLPGNAEAAAMLRGRVRQIAFGFRADRATNINALVGLLLECRNPETGIINPGHEFLARIIGTSVKTVARIISEVLEPAGIVAVVSRGVKLPEATSGETQAYVLLQPRTQEPEPAEPVDRNVHLKRNNQGYTISLIGASAKPRENGGQRPQWRRARARQPLDKACWEMANLMKRDIPDLKGAWQGALAKLIRPFVAAGDTLRDLKHRIDWTPLGLKWQFTYRVHAAIGWLKWRLLDWVDRDGAPILIDPSLPTNPTGIGTNPGPTETCETHELSFRPLAEGGETGCVECWIAHNRRQPHQPSYPWRNPYR